MGGQCFKEETRVRYLGAKPSVFLWSSHSLTSEEGFEFVVVLSRPQKFPEMGCGVVGEVVHDGTMPRSFDWLASEEYSDI
jgi:hypothetical protein